MERIDLKHISFKQVGALGEMLFAPIKKLPWALAKDAFLLILILVLVDVIVGEYLFYRYVLVPKDIEAVSAPPVLFNEGAYQATLQHLQEREQLFNQALSQSYADPFR